MSDTSTNARLAGVAMTLAAAVLWGTTGTAQHFAPAGTSPLWVGALRLACATLFFLAWTGALARRARAPARGWPRGAWPGALLAGACMAAYNLCFFAGVKAAGVALGTALAIGSGPVWAGALQALVTRRRPRPAWWLGTALTVAGACAMLPAAPAGGPVDAARLAGVALCLGAGLAYAAYTLTSQALVARTEPTAATLRSFGAAAALALPAAWLLAGAPDGAGGAALPASTWAVVAWLGVVSTGVAYLLFSHALRRISGATAVTLAMGEPVTAFALAILVVGEHPPARAFAGLLGVLAGLAVVVWAEARGPGPAAVPEAAPSVP
jgi:DME family drug/metabolite transporter